MGVSLTLLTLHVMLVLLAEAITSHHGHRLDRKLLSRSQPTLRFASERRYTLQRQKEPPLSGRKPARPPENWYLENPESKGSFTPCGEGMCKCSNSYADCSGHYGKLTYIPALPPSILFLNFSHNKLKAIEKPDFFANMTNQITGLSLSDNELSYIAPVAVSGLRNLTLLYLDYNFLSYNSLEPLLLNNGATLERLDVRGGNLGPLPAGAFFFIRMPRLKAINVYGNKLLTLNLTEFTALPSLEYLAVEANDIIQVVPDVMPSLRVLNLADNRLLDIPQTCAKAGKSMFPKLQSLDLSRNWIMNPQSPATCLPSLAVLDLSRSLIRAIPAGSFAQSVFPNLTILTLDGLDLLDSRRVEKEAFRNPNLRYLSMQNLGFFEFGDPNLDPGIFAGLPNLMTLLLNNDDFSTISEWRFTQLFANLTSLKSLSLRGSEIQQINESMLSVLPQIRMLDLSENDLTASLPNGAFDNLTSLVSLNLGTNSISMVTESTFGPETRERLTHLDLSANPFQCSADLMWFCRWMRANPALFNHSNYDYQCADKKGHSVTSICSADMAAGSVLADNNW